MLLCYFAFFPCPFFFFERETESSAIFWKSLRRHLQLRLRENRRRALPEDCTNSTQGSSARSADPQLEIAQEPGAAAPHPRGTLTRPDPRCEQRPTDFRVRFCTALAASGSTPITIARYGRSRNKTQDFEELSSIRSAEPSQSFSPNLGSPSPPETPNLSHCVSCIGKYLLLEPLEGDHVFRAVHLHSGEELVCKVFEISCYQESLAPCFCLSAHSNINQITEILLGETKAYVFFERSYGDMHSFVRTCKKLREEEAARLFYQIASAVAHCHDGGLVLRDLKLRKFIFKDEERTRVKLESLEDAYILRGDDDSLSDKHGCPAYVSPEILNTNGSYSGKAADVWSLGVMLYTMLVGRYPFHDIEPSSLFSKIRRGQFNIPETLSPKAKCLIRSILRREPSERLTSQEILDHPWFSTDFSVSNSGFGAKEACDQLVPDVNMEENLDPFFN